MARANGSKAECGGACRTANSRRGPLPERTPFPHFRLPLAANPRVDQKGDRGHCGRHRQGDGVDQQRWDPSRPRRCPSLLSPTMHARPPTSRPPLSVHPSRTRTNRRCRHCCNFHRRRGPELAILNQCRREYPTIIVGASAVAFATLSILRGRKTRTLMNLVIGGGFAQVGVSYLEIQDRKAKRG